MAELFTLDPVTTVPVEDAANIAAEADERATRSVFDIPPLAPPDPALTQNIVRAQETTPDAFAADRTLASEVGVPTNVVMDNTREGLKKEAQTNKVNRDLSNGPVTREIFALDPSISALAADDTLNLVAQEHAARELTFTGMTSAGVDLLQGLGYRAIEAVGEVFGAESLEDFGQEGAEAEFAAAARQTKGRQRFFDIEWDSLEAPGQLMQWARETFGEMIPLMAPSVVGGLGGAALGSAVPGFGTVVGAALGTFIPSLILGVGEVQQAVKERGGADAEASGAVFFGGALIAMLDSALPLKIGTTVSKAFGREVTEKIFALGALRIMRNAGVEGLKSSSIESVTEGFQQVISETAAAVGTNTEIDPRQMAESIVEAMAGGWLMGKTAGATTSVTTDLIKARRVDKALKALNTLSSQSKLRQRAPDKAAEVTAAYTEEQGVSEFFLPIDALLQFAAQHPDGPVVALEQLGVTQALDMVEFNAAAGVTKVAISAENFSRTVLGSEGFNILAPHLTVARDAKSLDEASEAVLDDAEIVEKLAAELEAADISAELKARVEKLFGKMQPGMMAEVIGQAPAGEHHVLMDLIQRVKAKSIDIAGQVKEGRVNRLDDEIAVLDREIDIIETEIEVRELENEGRSPSRKLSTKKMEKDVAKLVAKREPLAQEQSELTFVPQRAGAHPQFDTTIQNVRETAEAREAGEKPQTKAEALAASGKKITTKAATLQKLAVTANREAVRAAREGFREGLKVGKNLVATKKELSKRIDGMALGAKDKGKLKEQINNTETEAQLERAVQKVQSRAAVMIDRTRREQIKEAIKKVLKKTTTKVTGGYRQGKLDADIQEVFDDVRKIMKMSVEEAEARLEILSLSLDKDGLGALMEEEVMERNLLAMILNDENLSITDAENLLLDLNALKVEGTAAALARVQKRRAERDKLIAFGREAVTMGSLPTEELSTVGFFNRLRVKAKDMRSSLASMHNGWDELLDITFNKKGVEDTAPIEKLRITHEVQKYKAFVLRWEQSMETLGLEVFGLTSRGQMQNKQSEDAKRIDFGDFVNENDKTVRLQYSRAEIRKLWMEMQDPTLVRTVTSQEGMAFSQPMLDALFSSDMFTEQDRAYAEGLLEMYRKLYHLVNAIHRKRFGVNLPFNEFYSNIQRDLRTATGKEGKGHFGGDHPLIDEPKFRSQIPKQLKDRRVNFIPLKPQNDFSAMQRYIRDMGWFVEASEKVLLLQGVFKNAKLQRDIAAHHGESMNRNFISFLEDFGAGYAARGIVAEQYIGTFNRMFSSSVLALKGTIGTKQLVSWFAMADNIPAGQFVKYQAEFFVNPAKIVKFMWNNSAAVRERGSSLDFEMAKTGATEKQLLRIKNAHGWERVKFAFIRWGDRFPIYAGGWAVYQHNIAQGKTHEQAIRAFEDAFNTTQQSTDIDKMGSTQRAGAIGRTLTMFMTARLSLLRGELRAIRHFKRGKITWHEFGKRLAYYHVIIPMMIQFIASGFRWEPDRQAIAALLGQLNSFVIFGDVMMLAAEFALGDDRPFDNADQLPLDSMLREMTRGVNDAMQAVDDEELLDAVAEIGAAVGLLTGQPVDQVINIMRGVGKVVEGNVEEGMKQIWGFSENVAKKSADEPVFPR